MVVSVCLNPAIDRMLLVEHFEIGKLHRVKETRDDAAGKGVNVAVACRQLGQAAACTGFLGRENRNPVVEKLARFCVEDAFVSVEGAVRINTKVLDTQSGSYTELNQSGSPVSTQQLEELALKVEELAPKADFFVFSGSIPPGCPKDIYQILIQRVKKYQKFCILDAEGDMLSLGLQACPNMIKPNLFELETLAGHPLKNRDEILAEALKWVERGVEMVAVSMGGEGALATDGRQAYFAPALKVKVRGLAGAGDSMVAGFCKALRAGKGTSLEHALRCGAAAATASVVTEGTLLIDPAAYEAFLPQIHLEKMLI